MTLFSGIRNTSDTDFRVLEFDELDNTVKVYRDEFGVPSIIGESLKDILFVQGYEFARDRTWQLEFYRSLIHGELARLFGPDLVETDEVLRTIGLKDAADVILGKLDAPELELIESYVDGINKYYSLHRNNPPIEMQILRKALKPWTPTDTVAMASIVAFTFAFSGLYNEIARLEVIHKVGPEKSLDLLPVDYPPARDFIRNLNQSDIFPEPTSLNVLNNALKPIWGELHDTFLQGYASNNWVVSGNKTASGKPILSNDPHTNLEAQGIWYRVNLFSTDGSVFLQGLTFPGIPLLAFGHNQKIAWGVTSGILDTVDLLYLTENGTHYLVNDTEWKEFDVRETRIEISGADSVTHTIRWSEFGPMVDTDLGEFALMWTVHHQYPRDDPISSLLGFNLAQSVDEFHEALEGMLTGFNWVVASVDGDIAYQNTGFIPIRKHGHGLIPMNGSNGQNGWEGLVPYDEQLYVKNPSEGYFATANERVDDRENFYIAESYAHRYRNDRIERVLSNGTDFQIDPNEITIDDMEALQQDVKNLVPEDLLAPIIDILIDHVFDNEYSQLSESVVDLLASWDYRMNIDSVAALVFATFRFILVDNVVRDEIGGDLADIYSYSGIRTLGDWFHNNRTIHWFDNINTELNETIDDMVIMSLEDTVANLSEKYGSNVANWKWGDKHRVILPHTFTSITNLFDIGGDPASGCSLTVNAISGPAMIDGEIVYTSSYGPYFRMVLEVEESWSNVWGVVSSGASSDPFSPHYDDSYQAWLNYGYHLWHNNLEYIKRNYEFTAEFRRK